MRHKHTPPDHHALSAYAYPREFCGNRFIYLVVSPRAHGLAIGVNMNPDARCNFDCVYCEVDRSAAAREKTLNVDVMAAELEHALHLIASGGAAHLPGYGSIPPELLQLRHVALSGDGEPTFCPNFLDAVRAVVHIRALGQIPFKVVLMTNGTGLDLPEVQNGVKLFTHSDEIWAKLDAGAQDYMNTINHPAWPLEKILGNILLVAQQRPVIIQSLFVRLAGREPAAEEIEQYALRLRELKAAGAQIPLVQIYSAMRPTARTECSHLSLKILARIAERVREISGLKAEVF
ncbi:MAG: hypothetical protein KGR98_06655 [Verrucomicrobia bacterium]|nr:hypothetical protein [Verrucomicrobiota bacterium]